MPMNVLIISTNQAASPMPVLPSGACLVAEAAERAGHTVTLLDLMFSADPLRLVKGRLRKTAYDAIGLSVRNIDNNDMTGTQFFLRELRELIALIRDFSDAPLIMGGAACAVMPQAMLRYLGLSYTVIGEGEAPFCRILQRIEAGKPFDDIPGVAGLTQGIFRANPAVPVKALSVQLPSYSKWLNLRSYRSRMATIPIQTKLGCQFGCVYCTYRKIEGETYRLAEPEAVAEAARALTFSGLFDIEFVDNVFNAPLDHALAVCDSVIRAGIGARFQSVELNPSFFTHELVTAMERAGFVGIGLTVESASDEVLQGLRKGFTAADVHRASTIVRAHRLPCVWIFLLGGPGETEKTVLETLRFAEREIRPGDAAFFNIGIRIYPGTELETIARQQGVLSVPPGYMLEPVFYVSPGLDPSWLRERVRDRVSRNMHFMSVDTFNLPYLPLINRIGYGLGLRAPLWRYTRRIRSGLRMLGMNA